MSPERELMINRCKLMVEGLGWDIVATRSENEKLTITIEKALTPEFLREEETKKAARAKPA
jgi:hypothetical protein